MRLLATLALVALSACSNAPTDAQCEKLVAHVIELELEAAKTAAEAASDLTGKLDAEVGDSTRTFCETQLSIEQVQCGLAAKTSAELSACDNLRI